MKKLLIFFIPIFLFSCSNFRDQNSEITSIECPRVFFSSESNVFISSKIDTIDLEEVQFKASLNNYRYSGNCSVNEDHSNYNLNLLIIIDPINPEDENIKFPLFALLYDSNENLIDKQYFRFQEKLNYNRESQKYLQSEKIVNLNIILKKKKVLSSITIGFVKIKN